MLLTNDGYYDDDDRNEVEPPVNSCTLKKEVYDLMAERHRLSFIGIYLQTFQEEVCRRLEFIDRRVGVLENAHSSVLKKEDAEENMLNTLGGTWEEFNIKVSGIIHALTDFHVDKSDKRFMRRVKGM